MIVPLVTVYLNLDSASERREALEANFRRFAPVGWQLVRAPSIPDSDAVQMPGQIRATEKGCYLSHLAAIKSAAIQKFPLWIREDDTEIGPQTCSFLGGLIQKLGEGWDILYTDITVGDPWGMTAVFLARRGLGQEPCRAIPLSSVGFFSGALSYVLSPRFAKVLAAELEATELQTPIDLAMRSIVLRPEVRSFVSVPFLTTAADTSALSVVQKGPNGRGENLVHEIWELYRKSMWLHCDLPAIERVLDQILLGHDVPDSRILGKLIAALTLPHVKHV